MKIGFYDTDPAGGMIPMIIKLKEKNISFENLNNLDSIKKLNLVIINQLGLPHFPKEMLKNYCKYIRKAGESNKDIKFLIMVPGQEWASGMYRRLGAHKNIIYITNGDTSKLEEVLKEIK